MRKIIVCLICGAILLGMPVYAGSNPDESSFRKFGIRMDYSYSRAAPGLKNASIALEGVLVFNTGILYFGPAYLHFYYSSLNRNLPAFQIGYQLFLKPLSKKCRLYLNPNILIYRPKEVVSLGHLSPHYIRNILMTEPSLGFGYMYDFTPGFSGFISLRAGLMVNHADYFDTEKFVGANTGLIFKF